MAYSTQSDIEEILPTADLAELTDDTGNDVVDVSKVTAAIARADNQINSYLRGKQNSLPLSPVPPRVKDWSTGLAIWQLYRRRVNLEMPEPVRVDHDDIISELKAVRDNKILIDDAESPADTGSYYKTNGEDKIEIFDSKADNSGCLDQYYGGPFPATNRNRSS